MIGLFYFSMSENTSSFLLQHDRYCYLHLLSKHLYFFFEARGEFDYQKLASKFFATFSRLRWSLLDFVFVFETSDPAIGCKDQVY